MYSKLPVEIEAEKEEEVPVAMETEQDASADEEEIEDEGIEASFIVYAWASVQFKSYIINQI